MKLVIDIPEEMYKSIKNHDRFHIDADNLIAEVRAGIPLPKGHGRLIDEKDLSLMTVHLIDGMFVCDAQTIIEADRGDAE